MSNFLQFAANSFRRGSRPQEGRADGCNPISVEGTSNLVKDYAFMAGSLVLVRSSAIEMSPNRKAEPCYFGPMVVTRSRNNLYVLADSAALSSGYLVLDTASSLAMIVLPPRCLLLPSSNPRTFPPMTTCCLVGLWHTPVFAGYWWRLRCFKQQKRVTTNVRVSPSGWRS